VGCLRSPRRAAAESINQVAAGRPPLPSPRLAADDVHPQSSGGRTVVAITQVVSDVNWKADAGAGIKPGFFGEFTIIAGKVPDGVTTLTFKAIQSYSNGEQVAWIEQPALGSTTEPEHPAPELHLAAATGRPSQPPQRRVRRPR
jgi:hypothetical protein